MKYKIIAIVMFVTIMGSVASTGMFLFIFQDENEYVSESATKDNSLAMISEPSLMVDLLAFWNFEEVEGDQLVDVSNNNYNGIIIDGSFVPGIKDNCMQFDGINDYVNIGDELDMSDDFTIVAWIQTTPHMRGMDIVAKGEANHVTPGYKMVVRYSGEIQVSFQGRDRSHYMALLSKGTIWNGEWHQVVMRVKDFHTAQTELSVYIDGNLNNFVIFSTLGFDLSTGANLGIGYSYLSSNSVLFRGLIDEVMIFGRAVNEEEISGLYNYVIGAETIEAEIDFDPDVINEKSKGKWVTAFIELPDGYDIEEVDISSISLNDKINPEFMKGKEEPRIGDHNENGVPDFHLKFSREDVIRILDKGEDIEIKISGNIGNKRFEGFNTITVFLPPRQPIIEPEFNIIYSTDFSSNPNWETNNPLRYYWDSNGETYFASMVDNTDEYAKIDILYDYGSFVFEFDLIFTRMDWAADFSVGLYAPSMRGYSNPDQMIEFAFGIGDRGKGVSMHVVDITSEIKMQGDYPTHSWSLNSWYHVKIEYDPEMGTVKGTMTSIDDSQILVEYSIEKVTGFNNIACIALSKVGDWYAAGATANGQIDNIILYDKKDE